MSKIATSYDLFISSPGDVEDEKEINTIRKALDRFNREHRDSAIRILSVRWDSDIFLTAGKPLQSSIDATLDSCDFLVAIFRNRLGTPVDGYPSGTAKEILTSLAKGKQVFVYKLDKLPSDPTNKSYRNLLDFIDDLRERNVHVTSYSDCNNLEDVFMRQLNLYATHLLEQEIYQQSIQEVVKKGITHIKIGNAPEDVLKEKIASAKCVKILSTTGRALLSTYGSAFAEMLRNQGVLKFLLPNPGSSFLEDVEKIENRSKTNTVHREFLDTMGYLRRSLQRAENKGTIYVGCSYSLLRQTEILCIDPEDQIWSWITMTMPPLKAAGETLSFGAQSVQKNSTEALAYQANLYFDSLWDYAEKQKSVINFNKNQSLQFFYLEQQTGDLR